MTTISSPNHAPLVPVSSISHSALFPVSSPEIRSTPTPPSTGWPFSAPHFVCKYQYINDLLFSYVCEFVAENPVFTPFFSPKMPLFGKTPAFFNQKWMTVNT
ncbi:MAG: hypothetical protein ABSF70_05515 [Terracidiphilus sp.]|jgi:hypothetical protein